MSALVHPKTYERLRTMKKSKQCPKCDSRKVGYINHQPEADPGRWRIVAHIRARQFGEGSGPKLSPVLEAYVCTRCGFYESYVRAPEATPWAELSGFRMLNATPDSDGPYR